MIEGFIAWCGVLGTLCNLNYILFKVYFKSLGDWSDGGTPGNIPNPAVKAVSADGTWGAAPWESRSLPRDFFYLMTFF